jgi:hypothetical protein
VRRHQRDVGYLVSFMRDLSDRQSQLFLAIAAFLARYQPDDLHPLIDEDVAGMAEAMAATFETASRGVIYEHNAASPPAQRLAAALRPRILEAAGPHAGSTFQRDAAVVLRRLQDAALGVRALEPGNRRALVEMLARVVRTPSGEAADPAAEPDAPRLIVP